MPNSGKYTSKLVKNSIRQVNTTEEFLEVQVILMRKAIDRSSDERTELAM